MYYVQHNKYGFGGSNPDARIIKLQYLVGCIYYGILSEFHRMNYGSYHIIETNFFWVLPAAQIV